MEQSQIVDDIVTSGGASRAVEKSPQTIRNWSDRGWLSCLRTANGLRIYRLSDVRRVAEQQRQRRRERHHAGA